MSWAWEEFRMSQLADPRLERRLSRIIEGFVEHPEASCTEALGKAGAKAAVMGDPFSARGRAG